MPDNRFDVIALSGNDCFAIHCNENNRLYLLDKQGIISNGYNRITFVSGIEAMSIASGKWNSRAFSFSNGFQLKDCSTVPPAIDYFMIVLQSDGVALCKLNNKPIFGNWDDISSGIRVWYKDLLPVHDYRLFRWSDGI